MRNATGVRCLTFHVHMPLTEDGVCELLRLNIASPDIKQSVRENSGGLPRELFWSCLIPLNAVRSLLKSPGAERCFLIATRASWV